MKTMLSFSASDGTSADPRLPQSEKKSIKIIFAIDFISFTRFYAVKEYVSTHDPQIHKLLSGSRSGNHVPHPDTEPVKPLRHPSNNTPFLPFESPFSPLPHQNLNHIAENY